MVKGINYMERREMSLRVTDFTEDEIGNVINELKNENIKIKNIHIRFNRNHMDIYISTGDQPKIILDKVIDLGYSFREGL